MTEETTELRECPLCQAAMIVRRECFVHPIASSFNPACAMDGKLFSNDLVEFWNQRTRPAAVDADGVERADLETLLHRLAAGVFYEDYDEDCRLLGVFRAHLARHTAQSRPDGEDWL